MFEQFVEVALAPAAYVPKAYLPICPVFGLCAGEINKQAQQTQQFPLIELKYACLRVSILICANGFHTL